MADWIDVRVGEGITPQNLDPNIWGAIFAQKLMADAQWSATVLQTAGVTG